MADHQVLNIVVLGASFAGISVVHNLLQHGLPELLASAPPTFQYKVICISPSTHLYWNISSPRAIASPSLIPHEASFAPIAAGLKDYDPDIFRWIQGAAFRVDTKARTIDIVCPSNPDNELEGGIKGRDTAAELDFTDELTIQYHALVIATGSTAHSPLLSLRGPHTNTLRAMDAFHAALPTAQTIVISGGGSSGVETAGQLAWWLNHQKRRFQSVQSLFNKKQTNSRKSKFTITQNGKRLRQRPAAREVILVAGSPGLLPALHPDVGHKAYQQLVSLGVRVLTDVRVESAVVDAAGDGRTTVALSDGGQLRCDLYVPCTGVSPNTSFLDNRLLTNGYVSTVAAPSTLRVVVPDELAPVDSQGEDTAARVYAIGDCAAYSANCILDIYAAVPVLLHNLVNDLLAFQLAARNPYGGRRESIEELQRADAVYVKDMRDSQLVPIGGRRPGGVGVIFGFKLPSLLVYLFKGRTYKVERAKGVVVEGVSPY